MHVVTWMTRLLSNWDTGFYQALRVWYDSKNDSDDGKVTAQFLQILDIKIPQLNTTLVVHQNQVASFIHSAVCLTTGPQLSPQRLLHCTASFSISTVFSFH